MADYNIEKLAKLEQLILSFDKILFLKTISGYSFLKSRFDFDNLQNKKFFVILCDLCISEPNNLFVKKISSEETEKLVRLYYTYEFADNFFMITDDNSSVASIFNFVATGILTYEEAWQALLS